LLAANVPSFAIFYFNNETSFGELISLFNYLLSAILLLKFRNKKINILLILWFVCSFFEELSIPFEYLEGLNIQAELNFHNLYFIEKFRYLDLVYYSIPLVLFLIDKEHKVNKLNFIIIITVFILAISPLFNYSSFLYDEHREFWISTLLLAIIVIRKKSKAQFLVIYLALFTGTLSISSVNYSLAQAFKSAHNLHLKGGNFKVTYKLAKSIEDINKENYPYHLMLEYLYLSKKNDNKLVTEFINKIRNDKNKTSTGFKTFILDFYQKDLGLKSSRNIEGKKYLTNKCSHNLFNFLLTKDNSRLKNVCFKNEDIKIAHYSKIFYLNNINQENLILLNMKKIHHLIKIYIREKNNNS
jgi:hypothetical protein